MQFTKVVVGVDFSEHCERTVDEAVNIARKHGAPVVLVHAGAVPAFVEGAAPPMNEFSGQIASLVSELHKESRARLAGLRERFEGQGVTVSQSMIDAFADEGLVTAAEELGADLLVVGTHGRTGLRRFQLGSVAERVVRRATCTVMVARSEAPRPGGYRNVLVPVDFSEYTPPAIETAIALAHDEAHVQMFHAWHVPGGSYLSDNAWTVHGAPLRDELAAASVREGEELLARASRPESVKVSFVHAEGRPAPTIRKQLDAGECDLVVMGSHGRRGFRRWVLGSVAEATVRHASCSVVVVRRPDESE